MDILLLTPQLPFPPHQGTSLRNFHIIRGLSEHNQISLLSFGPQGGGTEIPPELSRLCEEIQVVGTPARSTAQRVWQMATSSKPDMALRLLDADCANALETMLRQRPFDIVQVEGIELAWTIPHIRRHAPAAAIVYDAHNAESLLQERAGQADRGTIARWPAVLYSIVQSDRLRRYEAWTVAAADAVTAVSEADSQALLALAQGRVDVTVVPNAIDVSAYADAVDDALAAGREEPFDVVFSGKMDYRPNVDAVLWFADVVWPLVLRDHPLARWAIVGQQPHRRLARLGGAPGLTITGWVPEVVPYLAGAKVFVMPFRVGSGTRLKLIEALASGRAVVSTAVGVEGFAVENGRDVLIAETAEEFARAISRLLDDVALRVQLGQHGRRFAERYDWRVLTPRFQNLYEQLVSRRSDSN